MQSRLVLLLGLLGGLLLANHALGADSSSRRAWLGVVTVEVPFKRLAALGLEYGVEVSRVVPRSPAAKAGLRSGDMILAIAKRPVYSVRRLSWLVDSLRSGQTVPVEYLRAGEKQEVKVELSSPAPRMDSFSPGDYRYRPVRSYLGVRLQAMTDDLRQAFGAPRDVGVLIAEVSDASPAAKAELKAGDVITRMDRKDIAEIADVYRVLDFFEPGDEVTVEVTRDKASKTLTVVLAAPPGSEPQGSWSGPWGSPPRIPAPFLEPHYWERQLDELIDRWRDYWREEPEVRFPFERRVRL